MSNKKLSFFVVEVDTGTMVFETHDEVSNFFLRLKDHLRNYFLLQNKNIHLTFLTIPKTTSITFFWLFYTREEYLTFAQEFANTEFINFCSMMGWKFVARKSGLF